MHAPLEEIKPETVEILATQAKARGLSVDEYLKSLLGVTNGERPPASVAEKTPDEKARAWEDWVASHSVSVSHFVDDSRESIYTREDEAL